MRKVEKEYFWLQSGVKWVPMYGERFAIFFSPIFLF